MPATNKIILGTVQFGLNYGINNLSGRPSEKEVAAILDLAFENGISLLDTAEAYGDAQEVIGRYHQASSNRFGVITKFNGKQNTRASLTERVAADLQALHVNTLYGYMFHSFNDFETWYPVYKEELKTLKQEGLVKKFGVSIYTNTEFEKLLTYNDVELVQLPFNLLDNTQQRAAWLSLAKAKGLEVHTRSVFLQGLFFKDANALPAKLAALKPCLDEINRISTRHAVSPGDIALHYAIQQEYIDHVLVGVDTAAQLKQNIASLQNTIPPAIFEEVDRLEVKETGLLNPANWNA